MPQVNIALNKQPLQFEIVVDVNVTRRRVFAVNDSIVSSVKEKAWKQVQEWAMEGYEDYANWSRSDSDLACESNFGSELSNWIEDDGFDEYVESIKDDINSASIIITEDEDTPDSLGTIWIQ